MAKKGFMDYGKDEESTPVVEVETEGGDDEEGDSGPAEMRLRHLAEQTGVDDPSALIKLIKACIAAG